MSESKQDLYKRGTDHVLKFVDVNRIKPITLVEETNIKELYGACGYYRNSVIHIDIKACAHIGTAGMAWSYPGYIVDRTPYGVLAHELGHHVDVAHGRVPGKLSGPMRAETRDVAITSYTPNDNEWFAEIFRLFVTNPDLLSKIRPKMFTKLRDMFTPVETRSWDAVIQVQRQCDAARNKIKQAWKHHRLM